MKATLIFNRHLIDEPEVMLHPESDKDRERLERLLKECHTTGFGRLPNGELIHVSIPLKPRESRT